MKITTYKIEKVTDKGEVWYEIYIPMTILWVFPFKCYLKDDVEYDTMGNSYASRNTKFESIEEAKEFILTICPDPKREVVDSVTWYYNKN